MSSSPPEWLPDEGIFLDKAAEPYVRPNRPLWQGDVFADVVVPFVRLTKAGEINVKELEGYAMLVGHPCSLRSGSTLAPLQNVVEARRPRGRERERFGAPWDTYLRLFPLEDLLGDGDLYVADFNVIGTVVKEHLAERRIACLSHGGWAAFQRRYAMHALRIDQPLDFRQADTQPLWNEITIWEKWCERGHSEPEFQIWLNEPLESGKYAGTTRRALLEFAPDAVEAELPEPVVT